VGRLHLHLEPFPRIATLFDLGIDPVPVLLVAVESGDDGVILELQHGVDDVRPRIAADAFLHIIEQLQGSTFFQPQEILLVFDDQLFKVLLKSYDIFSKPHAVSPAGIIPNLAIGGKD